MRIMLCGLLFLAGCSAPVVPMPTQSTNPVYKGACDIWNGDRVDAMPSGAPANYRDVMAPVVNGDTVTFKMANGKQMTISKPFLIIEK